MEINSFDFTIKTVLLVVFNASMNHIVSNITKREAREILTHENQNTCTVILRIYVSSVHPQNSTNVWKKEKTVLAVCIVHDFGRFCALYTQNYG